MDWSECAAVEVVPDRVSGTPVVRNSRVQADALVENYQSGSPLEEIAENFSLPVEMICQVLSYAAQHQEHLNEAAL